MQLTPQSQATMLLTVSFGKADASGAKPLSNGEWSRFAVWLRDHGLNPGSLLHSDLETQLDGWMDRTIQVQRLRTLLDRGAALGFALEKWQRAGLWVLTRSDREYPERLKRLLRNASPPVLFGCGNISILNSGGVAVVGSRDASDEELHFAGSLGAEAAVQGLSTVSGGARGVDEAAMIGALENGGMSVGVLADSLLMRASSTRFRKYLQSGSLVLACPFNPEAGFHAGNAMARNRYIYCLADAGVVVSSTPGRGGTWTGAVEALKHDWIPLWVKANASGASGNLKLHQLGAYKLPETLGPLSELFGRHSANAAHAKDSEPTIQEALEDQILPYGVSPVVEIEDDEDLGTVGVDATRNQGVGTSLYETFLSRLAALADQLPMNVADISVQLELPKNEVNRWVKMAVSDGRLKKLAAPVRYQIVSHGGDQFRLFGDDL